ncbi:Dehydrogenase/reductase SDR family member 11 [Camponotus japonicus]
MSRWANKTAIVIGVGSSVGQAITVALLKNGIHVYYNVDTKRDRDEIKAEYEKMDKNTLTGKLELIYNIMDNIEETLKKDVNILINKIDTFRIYLSIYHKFMNEAIKTMRRRQVEGHIFNINSVYGHFFPTPYSGTSDENDTFLFIGIIVSQHASVALTHLVRRQVVDVKPPIRVTSISPGDLKTDVMTEFNLSLNEFNLSLMPEDVADAIIYALILKPTVQITELIIQSTGILP